MAVAEWIYEHCGMVNKKRLSLQFLTCPKMIFLTFWPSWVWGKKERRKRNAQLLHARKEGVLLSVNKLGISSSASSHAFRHHPAQITIHRPLTSLKHQIGEHCQVQKTLTNPTGESFSILTRIFPRARNQSMLNIDNNGGAGASIDTKSTQHWYTFMHTSFIKQKTLPKVSHQNIRESKHSGV